MNYSVIVQGIDTYRLSACIVVSFFGIIEENKALEHEFFQNKNISYIWSRKTEKTPNSTMVGSFVFLSWGKVAKTVSQTHHLVHALHQIKDNGLDASRDYHFHAQQLNHQHLHISKRLSHGWWNICQVLIRREDLENMLRKCLF